MYCDDLICAVISITPVGGFEIQANGIIDM
jgi:hypothetical protein